MAFPFFEEFFGVTRGQFGKTTIRVALCGAAIWASRTSADAQSQEPRNDSVPAVVHGFVRDSMSKPVADAKVFLESSDKMQIGMNAAQTTHSDSQGAYRFVIFYGGSYILRAERNGCAGASVGPVNLVGKENKAVDLTLEPSVDAQGRNAPQPAGNGKLGTQTQPAFFDEPQFTVAGVTQASNSGGHGSDTVLRSTEALAKATVSLSDEFTKSQEAATAVSEAELKSAAERDPKNFDSIRKLCEFLAGEGKSAEALDCLQRATLLNPADGEVHHLLGTAEEKSGKPLEAVREYQRAAELDPSEENIFDWGTDLLKHRALGPANEVFVKGNRLFPKSVRMLVALGVSWYAQGSYDQATKCLGDASDLAPNDATPYLFMGKMLDAEINPSDEAVEKLARFAQLQPDRALANYYYAFALLKQSAAAGNDDHGRSALVETLLQKAIQLDPKLGDGYLQLGTLYSRRADYPRAIAEYQKAVTANPDLEQTIAEAHYHLSQIYVRIGDKAKAQEELQVHDGLTKKLKEDTERDRLTIQEFVVSLQNGSSAAPTQP
ncbi:MAG: tetratricopeptide repeat protein [Terriglobales bacterium]|jgi:tetratricopeptide (TPR) repeat protein